LSSYKLLWTEERGYQALLVPNDVNMHMGIAGGTTPQLVAAPAPAAHDGMGVSVGSSSMPMPQPAVLVLPDADAPVMSSKELRNLQKRQRNQQHPQQSLEVVAHHTTQPDGPTRRRQQQQQPAKKCKIEIQPNSNNNSNNNSNTFSNVPRKLSEKERPGVHFGGSSIDPVDLADSDSD
jgi:hypothetical protein